MGVQLLELLDRQCRAPDVDCQVPRILADGGPAPLALLADRLGCAGQASLEFGQLLVPGAAHRTLSSLVRARAFGDVAVPPIQDPLGCDLRQPEPLEYGTQRLEARCQGAVYPGAAAPAPAMSLVKRRRFAEGRVRALSGNGFHRLLDHLSPGELTWQRLEGVAAISVLVLRIIHFGAEVSDVRRQPIASLPRTRMWMYGLLRGMSFRRLGSEDRSVKGVQVQLRTGFAFPCCQLKRPRLTPLIHWRFQLSTGEVWDFQERGIGPPDCLLHLIRKRSRDGHACHFSPSTR